MKKKIELTDLQWSVLKALCQHPTDMVMHDGWLTGGHGIKIDRRPLRKLEALGFVKDKRVSTFGIDYYLLISAS